MARDRDDVMEFNGVVIETNKGVFRVQCGDNHIIIARPSGKMKINDVRIIVGDEVIVETSVYDLTLGRITKRFKRDQV